MAKKKTTSKKKAADTPPDFSPIHQVNEVAKLFQARGMAPDQSFIFELIKNIESNTPSKTFYVCEYLRWGNREGHSYIGEVCESYQEAVKAAKEHTEDRDGKYTCEIHEVTVRRGTKRNWSELYRVYRRGDPL